MPSVGMDLSDRSLKFLRLEPGRKGYTVKTYGKLEIPEGVISRGQILDEGQLVGLLKKARKEVGIGHVYVGLPEEHGYLFQSEVDGNLSPSETRHSLEANLKDTVPLAPEQTVFDYEQIAQSRIVESTNPFEEEVSVKKDKKKFVSVAAYPRELIEQYLIAFNKALLTPLAFEMETHATARAVVPQFDTGTYLIIDIGRTNAGLAIVSRGVVGFSATLIVGGDDFSHAIEKHLNVSAEEAEVLKNTKGFIQNEETKDLSTALFSSLSVLKDEVSKHCQFWNQNDDENVHDPVEKILLCGGNANMIGLPEYLEASVGLPAQRANVWTNAFSFEEVIPEIDFAHSLEYAAAVGLALRYAYK